MIAEDLKRPKYANLDRAYIIFEPFGVERDSRTAGYRSTSLFTRLRRRKGGNVFISLCMTSLFLCGKRINKSLGPRISQ